MVINLKGFIVGNGATDWDHDVMPSFPDVIKYFNILPIEIHDSYSHYGCTLFFNGTMKYDKDKGNGTECAELWSQMMDLTSHLNWYDLYRR